MDIIDCIKTRRSVRAYQPKNVEEDKVQELIQLATLAPTATAMQPWGFLVLQSKEKLDKMSVDIKLFLQKSMKDKPNMEKYYKLVCSPKFNVFNGAPTVLAIYGDEASSWRVKDCSLAAANVMLAAHSMGLGTCWIGFAESFMNTEEFKKANNVPQNYQLVCPLAMGYPKQLPVPPTRKAPVIF